MEVDQSILTRIIFGDKYARGSVYSVDTRTEPEARQISVPPNHAPGPGTGEFFVKFF